MAKVTASEAAEKWGRRLQGATEDIRRGVQSVTESPTEKAAAAADKMRERVIESIDSGKWQAGLRRVSLDEWKDAMLNKGVGRIAAGVQGAQPKMQAFMNELLPYVDNLKSRVDGMPDVTLEDSINRATAWIRGMSEFRRS
tara:strand:- start:1939 stop:2361 length:423 start_codon:yes stop_codon:yes gene_type:complete